MVAIAMGGLPSSRSGRRLPPPAAPPPLPSARAAKPPGAECRTPCPLDARGAEERPSVPAVDLFRTKSVEDIGADAEDAGAGAAGAAEGPAGVGSLRKHLSARHLIGFGIGVVIGTGIFTLTGVQAKNTAGPAVVISF